MVAKIGVLQRDPNQKIDNLRRGLVMIGCDLAKTSDLPVMGQRLFSQFFPIGNYKLLYIYSLTEIEYVVNISVTHC